MQPPDPARLLAGLERAGARLVLAASGGGAEAIARLVATPGASAVVMECRVPYARAAIDDWLGGPQESYCSSRTARRLAVAAWQRACGLGADPEAAVGAAVTAALRSRTPKRGAHRAVVAVQTAAATRVVQVVLDKGRRSRAEEEDVAAALVLDALAGIGGARDEASGDGLLVPGEEIAGDACEAPVAWRELFAGRSTAAAAGAERSPQPGAVVFPGSFDPLHEGHLLGDPRHEPVAERPVEYELSITNVDKPMLDYVEIRDRVAQFEPRAGGFQEAPVLWLTRAATFREKLDVFPGSTFVMGADTYARLAEPRYYGGSDEAARAAVEAIAGRARGLIVFGRVRDGVFQDAARIDVPDCLRDITYFVSQREFRIDISSTELRRRALEREEASWTG